MRKISLALLLITIAASGCTLHRQDGQQLMTIQLPASARTARKQPRSQRNSTPATIDDFTCVAINITGSGISTAANGTQCSSSVTPYFGIYSGWVPISGGTLQALVPVGSGRLIQVLGLVTSGSCPTLDQTLTGATPPAYEIGRQTADTFNSSTVTIQVAWSAATPNMINCAGIAKFDSAVWDTAVWGP